MLDCKNIIDRVAEWNLLLSMDVKAAYNHFPIDPAFQPYCGIVTQDWVYVYHKMTLKFNIAPCHFLYVICDILNCPQPGILKPNHSTYLDDCSTGGVDMRSAWQFAVATCWQLALARMPINTWKCGLLWW